MAIRNGIGRIAEEVVGIRGIKIAKYARLRSRIFLGGEPYTALNALDRKILPYLPDKGFFVEAGGNDGIDQSNTYFLEKGRGWKGLLVEPFEPLSSLSRMFRQATSVCAALGAPEDEGKELQMDFMDLMSSKVIDRKGDPRWAGWLGSNPKTFKAPVRTLSSILDSVKAPELTLLSLDVEGFELQALKGLDLNRHRPRFVLIETTQIDAVMAALGDGFKLEEKLSHHDYLIRDTAR